MPPKDARLQKAGEEDFRKENPRMAKLAKQRIPCVKMRVSITQKAEPENKCSKEQG
jgi:hypothetical protein